MAKPHPSPKPLQRLYVQKERCSVDSFNDDVRRIANLLVYDQSTAQIPPMLVAAAQLYLSYAPFDMPNEPERAGMEISGEFTAR